jgi:tripartite-type tricarboxylate transporter receptor subunit TctC
VTASTNRRTVLSLLAGAALLPGLPRWAFAAGYPDRAIHVAVPFSPGGAVDIVARTVMQQAGPQLGQPIVIENRPGASGNIATALSRNRIPTAITF